MATKFDVYGYLVILVSAILFLIFAAYMIYLFRRSAPSGNGLLTCLPGQCLVNRFSGIKTCGQNSTDSLSYDPVFDTCSEKYTCSDNINRFAETADGSTNNNGVCDVNVPCNCYPLARCSNFTLSYFNVERGNPYQSIQTQPIVFQEIPYYTDVDNDQNTQYHYTPPLRINNPLLQFCKIPLEWSQNVYPANFAEGPSNTINSGIQPNDTCLRGVFVYYPDNPTNFTTDTLDETLLACVIGSPVPGCTTPFFDKRINQINCLN